MRLLRSLALAAGLGLAAAPLAGAQAAPLTALDVLKQFNVVVSGNADFTSDVGGRTVVGGNLTHGAQFYTQPGSAAASDFRGLTVYGNSTGNNWASVNNGGGVTIEGTAAGGFNLNGGGQRSINDASANAALPAFSSLSATLTSLSQSLATLTANSTFNPNGAINNVVIQAAAGTGIAVLTIQASTLASVNSFSLDLNGNSSAIVNVIGNYTGLANFLNAQSVASSVIWNFVDATSVKLNRQWGGTVLAANAAVANTAQVFGTVFAASLDANAAWWSAPYSGSLPDFAPSAAAVVPEPATIAVFGLGLVGLMAARRRRAA